MKKYLSAFAEHILANLGNNLMDYCIVFPNKRAGFYFLNAIQNLANKPILTPLICPIEEFYEMHSPLIVPDTFTLLVKLFHSYKKVNRSNETFEQFYFLGKMLLNDFNDVDKQMINGKDLFQNIYSVKEIENKFDYLNKELRNHINQFWTAIINNKSSEEQKQFLQIWQSLYPLYKEYIAILKKDNCAYQGMLYRDLAKNAQKNNIKWKFDKVFIVGLNALNKCDEIIFQELKKENKVEFFWDYDKYYVDNRNHQAGEFIRKNLITYPETSLHISKSRMVEIPKKINIYQCTSTIQQAKILPEILSTHPTKKLSNTVIVLPDESMLIPLLQNQIKDKPYNLSLGFSLQFSQVYTWVELLANLHNNSTQKGNKLSFKKADVIALMKHPFMSFQYNNAVISEIELINETEISPEKLMVNPYSKLFFCELKDIAGVVNNLSSIFNIIFQDLPKTNNNENWLDLNKECIFQAKKIVEQINQLFTIHNLSISINEFFNILLLKLKETRIPLAGNYIEGIPVMGLLETRLLDFKHVVILSANEDYLPKKSVNPSFIPYYLRKGFNLYTKENLDSINSYYFYRLLHSAEQVDIFYSTKSQNLQNKEPSRFLQQLKFESTFNIEEKRIVNMPDFINKKKIKIKRNKQTIHKLETFFKNNYVSATTLNTYLDCNLKFYFQYIENIKDPIDTEVSDSLLLGNWFHEVARRIYQPLVGKRISINKYLLLLNNQKIKEKIGQSFNQVIKPNYRLHQSQNGKYLLLTQIVEKYIHQLLKFDKENSPFKILQLEKKITKSFSINAMDVLYLKGFIDRVDEYDDNIRIIDYKTGWVNDSSSDVESLFDAENTNRNNITFQLLFYTFLYQQKIVCKKNIKPTIYQFHKPNKTAIELSKLVNIEKNKIESFNDMNKKFSQQLKLLLDKMKNGDQDFSQTQDKDKCIYCPYAVICCRD